MIFTELFDLRDYITNQVKVNVRFGNADVDPSEYPLIRIIPDEEMTAHLMNTKLTTLDMPVNLKIVVDETSEIKAFETLDRLLEKINQYNPQKGHTLEETITPEYVDETKTYEINVLYNLKLLEHDQN
jgi:hypothetical protein